MHVLGQVEHGELDPAVLRVIPGHQLRLGLGEVEGRTVDLSQGRSHVDQEGGELQKDVPLGQPAQAGDVEVPGLGGHDLAHGQGPAVHPDGPARFGPTRTCMSATTLRSIQIVSNTATSSRAKMTMTLANSRIQATQSIEASIMPSPPGWLVRA